MEVLKQARFFLNPLSLPFMKGEFFTPPFSKGRPGGIIFGDSKKAHPADQKEKTGL
jgi:hypothetical protein